MNTVFSKPAIYSTYSTTRFNRHDNVKARYVKLPKYGNSFVQYFSIFETKYRDFEKRSLFNKIADPGMGP